VYARKHKPITMPDQVYLTLAPSHTKGAWWSWIVSPEYLANDGEGVDRDDFPRQRSDHLGLARLAEASGSRASSHRRVDREGFEGGRDALKSLGVPIHSLACITKWRMGN